jgi:hypothetical protein
MPQGPITPTLPLDLNQHEIKTGCPCPQEGIVVPAMDIAARNLNIKQIERLTQNLLEIWSTHAYHISPDPSCPGSSCALQFLCHCPAIASSLGNATYQCLKSGLGVFNAILGSGKLGPDIDAQQWAQVVQSELHLCIGATCTDTQAWKRLNPILP